MYIISEFINISYFNAKIAKPLTTETHNFYLCKNLGSKVMKTSKLILLSLICMLAIQPASAQSRSERRARIEREVKKAVDSKQYKINVNHMLPMKGSSRSLTSNYSVEIRNDSVFSYLPYFGEAYNIPYGGGKGLIFNAPISQYQTKHLKKGKYKLTSKSIMKKTNTDTALPFTPTAPPAFTFSPRTVKPFRSRETWISKNRQETENK